MSQTFNYRIADAQGMAVAPLEPGAFDRERYADYAASLDEKCRAFWQASHGLLVYRRFRVPEVFSFGCADMKQSLAWQLAALQASMEFQADVPNFLEPWYGIGTVASAFGAEYEWLPQQAPGVKPPFAALEQALAAPVVPVEQTPIGRHTLNMIEYFLDQTGGRVPMSLTDTQSPLNIAVSLMDTTNFLLSLYDNPDGVKQLMGRITDLQIAFAKKQAELIGPALVRPGHGFASSRSFSGFGMSDDTMLMLSDEQYREFEVPSIERCGEPFGGPVFHSCGNWSAKLATVKAIRGLKMVDGAFSPATDPSPNPIEPFTALAGSGICLNARVVGDEEVVLHTLKRICRAGMKVIAVTYCHDLPQQARLYHQLHACFDGK